MCAVHLIMCKKRAFQQNKRKKKKSTYNILTGQCWSKIVHTYNKYIYNKYMFPSLQSSSSLPSLLHCCASKHITTMCRSVEYSETISRTLCLITCVHVCPHAHVWDKLNMDPLIKIVQVKTLQGTFKLPQRCQSNLRSRAGLQI